MERSLTKGEIVEAWSNSVQAWIPGTVVLEAPTAPCSIDGQQIPAGFIKLGYPGGATKWVPPEQVLNIIRQSNTSQTSGYPDQRMERSFAKGDTVEAWSNSLQAWIPGTMVLEAAKAPCNIDGQQIPAGFVKLGYPGGATKWVPPHQVLNIVRKSSTSQTSGTSGNPGTAQPKPAKPVLSDADADEAEYSLTDPNSLAEFLRHANIRLVRAGYLYQLLRLKLPLPCRQEAEKEPAALVPHEEVSAWAAGSRDAMIVSVSHAWETREHPDPCCYQLKCLVDALALFDAAYYSDIWVFYDFVSLFQFERQPAEQESFDRSMQNMHLMYAHECTRTFRLENLTPSDVWQAMESNPQRKVRVYDVASHCVRDRALRDLVANRVPYLCKGWCKAEVAWSSARDNSELNQPIFGDPRSDLGGWSSYSWLKGKVPVPPEIFEQDMQRSEFTHRDDAAAVLKLQRKIFYLKVSECKQALFSNLAEGELSRLARALPAYRKLKILQLEDVHVTHAAAEEFAQVLASNETIRELCLKCPRGDDRKALVEAVMRALKTNRTITTLKLVNAILHDDKCQSKLTVLIGMPPRSTSASSKWACRSILTRYKAILESERP
ncbi:NLRC3 [Symbiodinium sp. CCMP2592]|nr:NLRC3 [Symbiodinium sp. CCMP2592]